MLKETQISVKDGFFIWFDKKYKKEYYISQIIMCKNKLFKEIGNKFNSIKLIDEYTDEFKEEDKIFYTSSDIISPFEENYGMFLINFLNADFSKFENAYLTFFCFYGMNLLEEYCKAIPSIRAFESEQDLKNTYGNIFNEAKTKLKYLQNTIKLWVNYTYNLNGITDYKNNSCSEKFISYLINKNLFEYTKNIDVYFNINYAYKTNDIDAENITPVAVKDKINSRIINLTESNIYNSRYISNIVYLCLNEIAINSNFSISICKNCGRYFISYKKVADKYCKITYSENQETCKDVGIQNSYKKKQESNPCLKLYRKTYQKKLMYAKRSEDEKVKQDFCSWKKLAREKVKAFDSGGINEVELIKWLEDG